MAAAIGLGFFLALTGCSGFFVDENTSGTGTGTGTTPSTADYVYVVNQTRNTVSAFTVGASTLTAIGSSPYSLTTGFVPLSAEVTRANTFVYVGGIGAIECFSIGSTGALTFLSAASASAEASFVTLTTSPDGQWLLALDSLSQTLYTFGINASTGVLTLNGTTNYTAGGPGTVVPSSLRVSPNGAYVIAALGTGGDAIFNFNTTTGVPTQVTMLAAPSGKSDNAVAIDANSAFVYFARGGSTAGTAGVSSYSLGSGGALTQVQALATTGNTPYSVLLDATGAYLYTANRADGTISGFSISSGSLTAISGSPYSAGTLATALVRDNSGKYVLAASFGGTPDLEMYSFDATALGKLDTATTAVSGTDPAGAIAVAATH